MIEFGKFIKAQKNKSKISLLTPPSASHMSLKLHQRIKMSQFTHIKLRTWSTLTGTAREK